MNVTLRQLRAFAAVARHRSFTAAAENLFLTQSALSGLIKELETMLGVRLFDRTTRHVELTEVGEEFLPLVSRLLKDLDHAISAVDDIKAIRTGVLRVAAPQLMACSWLPDVLGDFAASHPGIEIVVVDTSGDEVVGKVRSGEVDLAIGGARDEMPDVDALPLFDLPFSAVFPPAHPLAALPRLAWRDLTGHPVISLRGRYTANINATLAAAGSSMIVDPKMEVAYMTTALRLVSVGFGVGICQPYAQSLVDLYGLTMRVLHEPDVTRGFHLFTRSGRALSPAAQAFADFLAGAVESPMSRFQAGTNAVQTPSTGE